MQWHPIFAELLRPLLQDHFEVQTNVPVGDAPRESDIVLVRRTSEQPLPYRGIWRHLTTWNVVEFKGPTVDARLRDLDLLVELGLGIDRRLNEERTRQREPLLNQPEVSFWYLARHLGQHFQDEAGRQLRGFQAVEGGLWRAEVLSHPVYLVSIDVVAVDPDSVPMHLINREPRETELAVARVIVEQPGFWQLYARWLAFMHPSIWEEVQNMAREHGIETEFDLRPLFKIVGMKEAVHQMGWREVARQVGMDNILREVAGEEELRDAALKYFIPGATEEQRRELLARFQKSAAPDQTNGRTAEP